MLRNSLRSGLPGACLLSLLGLSFIVLLLFSAVHMDYARDVRAAADLVTGAGWPLTGPTLAGLFHIGATWYYLLAGMLKLSFDYAGSVVILGLVAALQFPLAYAAGTALSGSRAAGLLWAALLLLPSWSMFEQVFPGHPLLTGPTVAATLLFAIRYLQRGRAIDFMLLALSFSLALHAQLSNLVLLVVPLCCLIVGWRRYRTPWSVLVAAAALAALPFVPLLIEQWISGWTLFDGIAAYAASAQGQGHLASALPLLWQLSGGGLVYWFEYIAGWPRPLALLPAFGYGAVCALGMAGAVRRCLQGDRIVLILLASLLAAVVGLTLMRSFYAYYMTSGIHVLLTGVVAVGLAGWLPPRRVRVVAVAAVAVVVLGLYWAAAAVVIQHQLRGTWPFAFFPLFDVVSERHEHRSHPFIPAYAMGSSGRWLCRNREAAVHGAYGQALIHSYGVEAKLACGHADIVVGGNAPQRAHWVGLPRVLLERIGREPVHGIGSFGLLAVREVLGTPVPVTVPGEARYPALPNRFGDQRQEILLTLRLTPDEHLAVTHLSFGGAPAPAVTLTCEGRDISPVAGDNLSVIFGAGGCDGRLRLKIMTADPEHIDIVIF